MGRFCGFFFWLALLVLAAPASRAADAPRMGVDELRERLGSPELTVIDVRTEGDWLESGTKIAGAVREDPRDVGGWADRYDPSRLIVLYCS